MHSVIRESRIFANFGRLYLADSLADFDTFGLVGKVIQLSTFLLANRSQRFVRVSGASARDQRGQIPTSNTFIVLKIILD